VGGARFSVPVQTGPGAHPASCTMGNGSFPGVESGRGVTLTLHPLLVPRSKNRVELYLYSSQGPSWPIKRVKPTSYVHFDFRKITINIFQDFRYSDILRSADWQFVTDVSGQPIGPIFKSQTGSLLQTFRDNLSVPSSRVRLAVC
jgi:hypothetical protein